MIVATIITYNDWPLIKQCVESVHDQVDRIIVIDGKYSAFIGEGDFSTDGTAQYLESVPKVELYYVSGSTEVEKRNYYLQFVNEGDTVFNLDADEVLVGKLPELETDWGLFDLLNAPNSRKHRRATRWFKYKQGIEYRNVHYTLYYNNEVINSSNKVVNNKFSWKFYDCFNLYHNWDKRPHRRQHYKSIYYKKLVRMEAGFPK